MALTAASSSLASSQRCEELLEESQTLGSPLGRHQAFYQTLTQIYEPILMQQLRALYDRADSLYQTERENLRNTDSGPRQSGFLFFLQRFDTDLFFKIPTLYQRDESVQQLLGFPSDVRAAFARRFLQQHSDQVSELERTLLIKMILNNL